MLSLHGFWNKPNIKNKALRFSQRTKSGGPVFMPIFKGRTTAKEFARLAEWLRANGMTDAQIIDCLKYIAGTTPPTSTAGK